MEGGMLEYCCISPGGGTVDAADLKSAAVISVWVRIPPGALCSPIRIGCVCSNMRSSDYRTVTLVSS